MALSYTYIKAFHIIFVITWFAGLFYIPRLYIYFIESHSKPEVEKQILSKQFLLMAKRLWHIITWPSAILTIIFATWLLLLNPFWIKEDWMQLKLIFVIVLLWYHIKSYMIYRDFIKDKVKYSSNYMRMWNEGATILLFIIVFLVVLKNAFTWILGVLGLLGLILFLMLGIRLYNRLRSK